MAAKFNLKLLVDTNMKKVIFAEAGKAVVDFLFSLISMPIGNLIKLIAKDNIAASLGSIYESLKTMDGTYLLAEEHRQRLLNPNMLPSHSPSALLPPSTVITYFACGRLLNSECYKNFTDSRDTPCPNCKNNMNRELRYVDPVSKSITTGHGGEGYVKEMASYMVTDDLTIKPMSTIFSISLLNKFQVKDFSALKEIDVELGMEEALKLLKALGSNAVLTEVFLGMEYKSYFIVQNEAAMETFKPSDFL